MAKISGNQAASLRSIINGENNGGAAIMAGKLARGVSWQ